MAGYADIDSSSPLGSAAPNTIDNIIRTLKANILAGMSLSSGASCINNGQSTADHQGMLTVETRSGSDPSRSTPDDYIYIRRAAQAGSGDTESSFFRRKTSSGWTNVGLWLKQALGLFIAEEGTYASEWQTVAVNTQAHVKVEIATFTAGSSSPRFFSLLDVDYAGVNAPNIVFGPVSDPAEATGSSASAATNGNIFVWISKSITDGKYYLNVWNDTANNENVEVCLAEMKFN